MTRTNQTIQVAYWQKAKQKGLTPEEKLVELFLMTCPECGASGVFRMDASSISADIGYTETKVKGILQTLQAKDRVYSFEGNWVFVVGKYEYEPQKSAKINKCVERELSTASNQAALKFTQTYDTLFPTLRDTLCVTSTSTDTVTNTSTLPDSNESESQIDSKYIEAVKEIFPQAKANTLSPQAETLEQIARLDGAPLTRLLPALKWATTDEFWTRNFLSCSPLRKRKEAGGAMKWEKIEAAYKGTNPANALDANVIYHCTNCGTRYTAAEYGAGTNPCTNPECDPGWDKPEARYKIIMGRSS